MIAILDYGAGNLRSVETGFARAGVCAAVTSDPDTVLQANGVVLPAWGPLPTRCGRWKTAG